MISVLGCGNEGYVMKLEESIRKEAFLKGLQGPRDRGVRVRKDKCAGDSLLF